MFFPEKVKAKFTMLRAPGPADRKLTPSCKQMLVSSPKRRLKKKKKEVRHLVVTKASSEEWKKREDENMIKGRRSQLKELPMAKLEMIRAIK